MVVRELLNKGMDFQAHSLRIRAVVQIVIAAILVIVAIVMFFIQPIIGVLCIVIAIILFFSSFAMRRRAERIVSRKL